MFNQFRFDIFDFIFIIKRSFFCQNKDQDDVLLNNDVNMTLHDVQVVNLDNLGVRNFKYFKIF